MPEERQRRLASDASAGPARVARNSLDSEAVGPEADGPPSAGGAERNQSFRIAPIKKRADFLRISAEGRKFAVNSFILLAANTPNDGEVRVGLTVTKKLGNAVVRNRIKRRLREAFRQAAPGYAVPGHDYVLIARKNALLCPFSALIGDLQFALPRAHKARSPHLKEHKHQA